MYKHFKIIIKKVFAQFIGLRYFFSMKAHSPSSYSQIHLSVAARAVVFLLALMLGAHSSFAVDWATATNGDWSDGSKWTGGTPPTSAQAGNFNDAGTYTVSLTANTQPSALTLSGSVPSGQAVTLDVKGFTFTTTTNANGIMVGNWTTVFGGHDLTITNTGAAVSQVFKGVTVYGPAADQDSVTFHNLGNVTTNVIYVGEANVLGGNTFTASGATSITTASTPLINGGAGAAGNSFRVIGGASFTATNAATMALTSSGTTVLVSGAGSQFLAANYNVRLGSNSSGSGVVVEDGGTFTGNLISVGYTEGAVTTDNNTLTVTGTNSQVNAGALAIGDVDAPASTGNKVTVGSGGLVNVTGNFTLVNAGVFDLAAGGTLQAAGATFSSAAANQFLFNGGTLKVVTTGQTRSIDATMVNSTTSTIDTNGNTLSWSGILSSGGGLAKEGAGTLTLSNANTYAGGTLVNVGTLVVSTAGGTLGTGDVDVLGTAINLTISTGVTNAISDSAFFSLAGGGTGGTADFGYALLGAGVNETVQGLYLGGILQAVGTYGSTASSATFKNDEYFSGTGIITTVVPEPRTWALLAAGLTVVTIFRRRRKS